MKVRGVSHKQNTYNLRVRLHFIKLSHQVHKLLHLSISFHHSVFYFLSQKSLLPCQIVANTVVNSEEFCNVSSFSLKMKECCSSSLGSASLLAYFITSQMLSCSHDVYFSDKFILLPHNLNYSCLYELTSHKLPTL